VAIHVLVRASRFAAVNTHVTLVRSSRADVGVFTHASMQVPPLSLHPPAVDCPRNEDRAADGGAFMYLILIDCQTNTYTRRASAHSLTLYTPAVDWHTKLGRERKLLVILIVYWILGYSDLVFPDSGWFQNRGSEYWKIRQIRMLPDSELTARSGFRTRIRHTPGLNIPRNNIIKLFNWTVIKANSN